MPRASQLPHLALCTAKESSLGARTYQARPRTHVTAGSGFRPRFDQHTKFGGFQNKPACDRRASFRRPLSDLVESLGNAPSRSACKAKQQPSASDPVASLQGIEPCFADLESASRPSLRPIAPRTGFDPVTFRSTGGRRRQLTHEAWRFRIESNDRGAV